MSGPKRTVRPFSPLALGQVKPLGWIRRQMLHDLKRGFVGHLDQLVPDLILEDDIYGRDRLSKNIREKDLGVTTKDVDWGVQYLWWNSETQSNWWDGVIRHAFLTDHAPTIERVRAYVDVKLATQDADGYIGIYDQHLRYRHNTENGELWAQTTLFRGLLAYYEATGERRVLTAVERAVRRTMEAYPMGESEPFHAQAPDAGVCHGLTFTDILYQLEMMTGDHEYLDYAVFLYDDYNRQQVPEEDIKVANLSDPEYALAGHAVHTCEHLRTLAIAARQDPRYRQALPRYLEKLKTVISPSGGPIGDEWMYGRVADSDRTGYEYCSLQEMLHGYLHLLQETGQSSWADAAEQLLFNAAQGARHPEESAVAMTKSDSSYVMLADRNAPADYAGDPERLTFEGNARYKYSPTHQDAAVCCAPNASRIYPYYVQSMWAHTDQGIAASFFGPSVLETRVHGVPVRIEQKTDYPFDLTVELAVDTEEPVTFRLSLRRPAWAREVRLDASGRHSESKGYLHIDTRWEAGDTVRITFFAEPEVHQDLLGRGYVSLGPLVFALPLAGRPIETRQYPVPGFRDLLYDYADDPAKQCYRLPPDPCFEVVTGSGIGDHPFQGSVMMRGELIDPSDARRKPVTLVPMGGTVLRKVTFELAG